MAIASITDALGAPEAERKHIQGELAALEIVPSLDVLEQARIRAEFEALLDNWRDLLTQPCGQEPPDPAKNPDEAGSICAGNA